MFNMPGMVDMRRTPEEKAEALAMPMAGDYPWGLSISLDTESLKKLEVDFESVEVGQTYHFMALAKVTAKSRNENDGGEARECIELQITDLNAENEDMEGEDKEPLRKKMYK